MPSASSTSIAERSRPSPCARRARSAALAAITLALVAAAGCAGRSATRTSEPRGRAVCYAPTPLEQIVRPGDKAISLRHCGPPLKAEQGHRIARDAPMDDVLRAGLDLGESLIVVDVVSAATGESMPGRGWVQTTVYGRLVDGVNLLRPNAPVPPGVVLPLFFADGTVTIDGVAIRTPDSDRAAFQVAARYLLFVSEAHYQGFFNGGPAWIVGADGRIVAPLGRSDRRRWMRTFVGRPADEIMARLRALSPAEARASDRRATPAARE